METRTLKLTKRFVEEILEKIIEQEKEKGRYKTSYAEAGEILLFRINKHGGLL